MVLDKKFKEPLNLYTDGSRAYDIRVFEAAYIETDIELLEESKEENDAAKKSIMQNYKKVKQELRGIAPDETITMAVRSIKEVIVDEYNKDLANAYKDGWYDYDSVKDVMKLKEIYLDEEYNKALLKKYNLKEEKYIGVEKPPAIVFNVRRLYSDSLAYYEGKIKIQNPIW